MYMFKHIAFPSCTSECSERTIFPCETLDLALPSHRNRGYGLVVKLISLVMIPSREAAFRKNRAPRWVLITLLLPQDAESALEMNDRFVRWQTCDDDRDGRLQDVVKGVQFIDPSRIARAQSKRFDNDDKHTDGEQTCHGDLPAESHLQIS